MKRMALLAVFALAALAVRAETVTEVEKQIQALGREATQLKKNPIFVWGYKQENLDEKQKCSTAQYNIVKVSRTKEFKKYRSKTIIALNPVYVCPLHKCLVENGTCSGGESSSMGGMGGRPVYGNGMMGRGSRRGDDDEGGCKAMKRLGTSNFANLGKDYDLSYRSWKLMKDKMPESEAQEKRLAEIDEELGRLKERKRELMREQSRENSRKWKAK